MATSEMSFALNGKVELIFQAEAGQRYVLRLASKGDEFGAKDTFTVQWDSSVELYLAALPRAHRGWG